MKIAKNFVLLIFIFTLFGCTRQFQIAKIVPGKTDIVEVINYLGNPEVSSHKSSSSFNQEEEVLFWSDVQVQVHKEDNIVVAVHRSPAHHEKSLQFWRQHYKDTNQIFKKINSKYYSAEHTWQLDLPALGINVVYDETRDEVLKVVYYEVE